jgi:hypothetical protein
MEGLNSFLDQLPRPKVGRPVRDAPTYRTCGIVGFYMAVVATMTAGILASSSLLVLSLLSAVSALSFFGYATLRIRIAGRQNLVLLEHVWVALLSCAVTLSLLQLPVLSYLDDVAVGLCFFLAGGRVGCFLSGCCYGLPSGVGVRYSAEHVEDGFPSYLVGVRLFPVQLVEAGALVVIGIGGLAMLLRFSPAGTTLTWFLVTYAIVRFGLDGLRGDRRQHFLGLSRPRWMCMAQFGIALALNTTAPRPQVVGVSFVALSLAAVIAGSGIRRDARRLLARKHLREVTDVVNREMAKATTVPALTQTSRGLRLAVSAAGPDDAGWHMSLSLANGASDVSVLCELAAAALHQVELSDAILGTGDVLHIFAAKRTAIGPSQFPVAEQLMATVARAMQDDRQAESSSQSEATHVRRSAYFAGARTR